MNTPMSAPELIELLEHSAVRLSVGAPPTAAMIAEADAQRRRRGIVWSTVAAAAVIAVIGGTVMATGTERGRTPDPAAPTSEPQPVDPIRPIRPGSRLVGIGHTTIAVPKAWATNALRCGTAKKPTVVIDVTAIPACAWTAPETFDEVWIEPSVNKEMFKPTETFTIDGVEAQRDGILCFQSNPGQCRGTVFIPSANASYQVRAATHERVAEIQSWIRIVPDQVAVPGFGIPNMEYQDENAGEHYRAALEAAGLAVEVVTESRPGMKTGFVLAATPTPGTMLAPGTVVTMTEVAPPSGPGEKVSVGINSVGPDEGDEYQDLSDEQIRANGTIRLQVGATIWAYGDGPRIETLTGRVGGDVLELDDWKEGPNYGRSWKAVIPGTATLRLTITADGKPITLGTVTVVVG